MKKTQKPKVCSKRVRRVVVAMSGGVDSSVAAALLKRAGFEVVGVFMKFWLARRSFSGGGAGYNRCCTPEAEKRAREVARILGIPFYVFDFEKEFKKKVVDYFLEDCKNGRTPNPCVVCNKEIKFGLLLEKVLALGADFVATGHYARLRPPSRAVARFGERGREIPNSKFQIPNHRYHLLGAKDKEKDQSYFLWQLSQKQLSRILFPIGDFTKAQVRNLAQKFKLPVSDAPESMEICFIRTTVRDFLAWELRQKPGKIVTPDRKIIGEHQGLAFYTIGQRRGIKLASGPYYVLTKDIEKNLLVVTKNPKDLYKKEVVVGNVNWISGEVPKLPIEVKVKIRYRHKPAKAIMRTRPKNTAVLKIKFHKPQKAITPGQSAVFYLPAEASAKAGKGEELMGGGVIKE